MVHHSLNSIIVILQQSNIAIPIFVGIIFHQIAVQMDHNGVEFDLVAY